MWVYRACLVGVAASCLVACSSKILQHEHSEEMLRPAEFEQKIEVKEDVGITAPPPIPPPPPLPVAKDKKGHKKHRGKKAATEIPVLAADTGPRQPDLEDREDFKGRRPVKDPLWVGEKVTLALTYFRMIAGNLDLMVKPFAEVNHERAYHLEVTAKTNTFFSRFYAVDDKAVTYLSYDKLIPLSLNISIKESKQLAEARTYFDWKTLTGDYWQNRITKEHGEQKKSLQWPIQDYSQNVISAAYYMRMFKMTVGHTYSFRVADEGKNIVFKGEVLRKEKLDTDIGEMDTIVVRPTLTVDGAFAPVGEITFWLTDDDRKFIVRIESKIKIGTLVARVVAIEKGTPPSAP